MNRKLLYLLSLFTCMPGQSALAEEQRPIIVELFTSHGCSSCPAADKIVKEFAESDKRLMPLSFHVTYWDYLGWKDPYASDEATSRQRNYAQLAGKRNVFTPQVMVDGVYSAVGNNHDDVNNAIRQAENAAPIVPISIKTDKYDVLIDISAKEDGPVSTPSGAVVWLFYYNKYNMTPVNGGENSGKTIENINNVVDIKRLGYWHNSAAQFHIPKNQLQGDGLVVILQSSPQNQILGAAVYDNTKS